MDALLTIFCLLALMFAPWFTLFLVFSFLTLIVFSTTITSFILCCAYFLIWLWFKQKDMPMAEDYPRQNDTINDWLDLQ